MKIAIVGTGIAGMTAAYRLHREHDLTIFEANNYYGGHTATVDVALSGQQYAVDTGFIVFNDWTYPNFIALIDELGVPWQNSNMSFSLLCERSGIEYNGTSLNSLFAQRRNVVSPRFLRMCRDILHFNAKASETVTSGMSMRALLAALGTGDWFRDYYILPISGAIWSTPSQDVLSFPAETLIRFFRNHALMSVYGQHQWFTVQGGSVAYVRRLQAAMLRQGVDVRLGAEVAGVRRTGHGVLVRALGAEWELFDEVVFASHSDDTLRMLADATPAEYAALSAVRYQPNQAVLHADAGQMPRLRKAWASWVYTEPAGPRPERIDLTYWMNSLQNIPQDDPLFVTLNPNRPIREDLIHDVVTFRHPVFDAGAIAAQGQIAAMNGQLGTWFCGAWMRHGFHEDGMASAVAVVQAMQARRLRAAA